MFTEQLHRIYKAVVEELPLKEIAKRCCNCIGNPIIIRDSIGNVLSYSPAMKNSSLWTLLTKNGKEALLSFETLKKEARQSNGLYLLETDEYKEQILYAELSKNEETWGYLIVLNTYRPFTESDYLLIKEISDLLFYYFHVHYDLRFVENPNTEFIMSKLIHGDYIPSSLITKYLFQKQSGYRYRILICGGMSKIKEKFIQPDFYNILALKYKDAKRIIYDDNIVFLFYRKANGLSVTLPCEELFSIAQKFNLTFGFSDSFDDLINMRRYYDQAITALTYGNIFAAENRLFFCNDFYFFKILNTQSTDTVRNLCSPSLLYLIEYDIKYKTNWLLSLCELILNDFNVINTAKALGIHRSSLYYHIEKIEEILGISLRELRQSSNLLFSFFILVYLYHNGEFDNEYFAFLPELFAKHTREVELPATRTSA